MVQKMYKQTILINNDLKMGKGKVVGQALHGEVFYMEMMNNILNASLIDDEDLELMLNHNNWMRNGLMPKIILKVSEKEMMELSEKLTEQKIWNHIVQDCGFTQIPAKSRTCCCVAPLSEEVHDKFFKNLKLL